MYYHYWLIYFHSHEQCKLRFTPLICTVLRQCCNNIALSKHLHSFSNAFLTWWSQYKTAQVKQNFLYTWNIPFCWLFSGHSISCREEGLLSHISDSHWKTIVLYTGCKRNFKAEHYESKPSWVSSSISSSRMHTVHVGSTRICYSLQSIDVNQNCFICKFNHWKQFGGSPFKQGKLFHDSTCLTLDQLPQHFSNSTGYKPIQTATIQQWEQVTNVQV